MNKDELFESIPGIGEEGRVDLGMTPDDRDFVVCCPDEIHYPSRRLFRFSHEDQQCMIDILQLLLEELRITSDMLQGLRNP